MTVHVLVIDDDPLVRRSFEMFLTNAGYRVSLAVNGLEGLRLFRSGNPDVVVTDIIMPEQEGIQSILEMLALNPNARIIAVTGSARLSDMNVLAIAAKLGAAATLQKPIDQDQLVGAIKQLLGPAAA